VTRGRVDVRLREQFARAGFDAGDAARRAALADGARTAFVDETGHPPEWAWFVPGRIEIFGKHTDYAGGRSLVAAVPRGFAVVAGPRNDGIVAVIDARWRVSMEVRPDDPRKFAGWASYAAVVTRRLASNFPGAGLGATIVFSSDLPRAAGLSSSSALVVGIATALARRAGLADRPEWRAALPTTFDLAGYLGAVENGLTFGALAGTRGVGTHGGSEDHTAILTCQANRVTAYSYVPVRRLTDEAMPDDWRFVVMGSGVEADKAGSARRRYNRASLATRALVDVWRGAGGDAALTLAEIVGRGPEAIEELRGRLASVTGPEFTGADLSRRLAHFIAENDRVLRAAEAFRRADARALGELSAASQAEADTLLGNQIHETRTLAALARETGAFAASSFGAGFGGSVWALASADDAGPLAERWRARYLAAVRSVPDVPWFVARPSPATFELDLTGS
jgi:galactokinase